MRKKFNRFIALLLVALLVIPSSWITKVTKAATNDDIPVFLYHRIVQTPSNQWTDTSIDHFNQTMKYLHDNGYNTLSSEQYVNILEGKEAAPDKPILLTFDDATPDFVSTALPVLKQYNMNAILFVVSSWIGGGYSMTLDQLKSVANEPNISIESHSKTHSDSIWGNGVGNNSSITKEQATDEIASANTFLKSITGKDPILLAYPYGSYNDAVKQAAQENGIKYGFKVGTPNGADSYEMARYYVLDANLSTIAGWVGGPTPPPENTSTTETIYHETFANGIGMAKQSGNAKLEVVSGKAFDGNDDGQALYVSNRTNDYDAADFNFSEIGLENGKTYTVTVRGYVDNSVSVPTGGQAVLSAVASYTWLSNVDLKNGQAFTLTKEFTVDTSKDTKLRVQSNPAGAAVPFYIGDVLITATKSAPVPTTDKEVYHEAFANGQGVATQSGGANLTTVTNKDFDGNDDGSALYISNRTNDYDAADFSFNDIGLENGKTYTVTVKGYVDSAESVPTDAQAVLSTVDSYTWLSNVNYEAGKPFVLTKEFVVDTSKDVKLRVQSNPAGASVPFYIGDILITEKVTSGGGTDTGEQRPPAETFNTITFEDQTAGGFEGRAGTETLTVTNEANHTGDGSYALKVEGRTEAWNGPTLHVEKYVDLGQEYKISAWIKLISPESSQLQLSTQVGNGGSASYNNLQGKTISAADGWVKLEGTYRYTNAGGEFLTIYVESSNNAEASFYIDDISFEPTGSAPIEIQDLTPIKDVYQNDFLIGNAVSLGDLDGVRGQLLNKHFNVVTAENAMKPDQTYNADKQFDFADEDALVDKIKAAGLKLHGHVLVWHQQTPEWLFTGDNGQPLSRDEALTNLRNHVKTVVEHYGTNVISWDVVNEAIMDGAQNPSDWKSALRQSGWYKAIGPDFVEQAFLAAREVLDEKGWDIKLYYNDYNDDNQNKAEAIYQMVKEINEKYAAEHNGKLLIDGIGMQSHYNKNTNPDNVKLSMEKFISLGVEVSITELDVQAGTNNQLTEQEANAQGYLYAQLFKIYKEHADHIGRVTFWGLNDATSWRAATSPLIFDKDLQAKPAYYGVIDPDKFMAENAPEEKVANQGTAVYGTPSIDGTVDDVWANAPELQVNRYQMAWQGASGVAKVLWDDENLYILTQVSDSQLDKSSVNPWEQDSVEVFVDENNAKTSSYEDGDGQYRVNFDNEASFNPGSIEEGFESATHISDSGYTVEMKIPLKTISPEDQTKIGFDVQINDGQDGARQSAATWNDTTGNGYQDTSVFGVVTLVKSSDGDNGGSTPGEDNDGSTPGNDNGGSTQNPDTDSSTPGTTDDSNELPTTATSTFNNLLAGFMLLLAGTTLFMFNRRRRV